MNSTSAALTSMLDTLVNGSAGSHEAPGQIRAAIVSSSDGLVMVRNSSLDQTQAETFAAAVVGLHSASRGLSTLLRAGAIREIMVNLEHSLVMVMSAGANSRLAVAADPQADMGWVAYEMSTLVQRLERHLGSASRNPRPVGIGDPTGRM